MSQFKIIGAGPVGSLLSICLSQKGHQVEVFEKRLRPVHDLTNRARSINLALSHRGFEALSKAGLADEVRNNAIPMYGRMIHHTNGNTDFQAYSSDNKAIYAVERSWLNYFLVEKAIQLGVKINFDNALENVKPDELTFRGVATNTCNYHKLQANELVIGTDGAHSVMSNHIPNNTKEITKVSHGYKEFTLPASELNTWAIEKNALHIWPRHDFMLIALPNMDHTFTCTLFLANEGLHSFAELDSDQKIKAFFETNFPDFVTMTSDYLEQYHTNPLSRLEVIKNSNWVSDNRLLMGDAAHAIVPFYGQGLNAGLEDVSIFCDLYEEQSMNATEKINRFFEMRKINADAISTLALDNFIEMRDQVIDETYKATREVELSLYNTYGESFTPLYEMVTFTSIPYNEAMQTGYERRRVIREIIKTETDIKQNLQSITEKLYNRLQTV